MGVKVSSASDTWVCAVLIVVAAFDLLTQAHKSRLGLGHMRWERSIASISKVWIIEEAAGLCTHQASRRDAFVTSPVRVRWRCRHESEHILRAGDGRHAEIPPSDAHGVHAR